MRPIAASIKAWFYQQWPPFRLLLATLAIPLTAAILWHGREPLAGWCRLRLIAYHLSRGDRPAAAKNASSLLALSSTAVAKAVQRACRWPAEYRRWLAEAILPLGDNLPMQRKSATQEAYTAQRLEWVLQLDPDQREALVMSAERHYRSGHYRRAAAALKRAISLAPSSADASYWEYYLSLIHI